jgi:hypothetical protein
LATLTIVGYTAVLVEAVADMVGTTRRGRSRRGIGMAALSTLALIAVALPSHAADAGRIEGIRVEGAGPATKVVITLSRPLEYDVQVLGGDATGKSARRLVLDFSDSTLGPAATKPIEATSGVVRLVRTGQFNAKTARVVVELASDTPHTVEAATSPAEVTIAFGGAANSTTDIPAAQPPPPPAAAAEAAAAPKPAVEASSASNATAGLAAAPRPTPRAIPIRARGRRPYTLNYSR